jgi:hypothetical protein
MGCARSRLSPLSCRRREERPFVSRVTSSTNPPCAADSSAPRPSESGPCGHLSSSHWRVSMGVRSRSSTRMWGKQGMHSRQFSRGSLDAGAQGVGPRPNTRGYRAPVWCAAVPTSNPSSRRAMVRARRRVRHQAALSPPIAAAEFRLRRGLATPVSLQRWAAVGRCLEAALLRAFCEHRMNRMDGSIP